MTPGKILVIALIAFVIFFVAIAAADDCGCDGGSDSGDSGSSGGSGGSGGSDTSSSDSGSSSSSSSSEDATVWRLKGDDLFKKGLFNESLAAYGNATTVDPYSYRSWTGTGRALLSLGDFDKAGEAFQKAIDLDPGNAEPHVLLGDALVAGGSYEDAVVQYRKALALDPNLVEVKEKITLAEEGGAMRNVSEKVTPETTVVIPKTEPPTTGPLNPPENTTPPEADSVVTPRASFPGLEGILIALVISSLVVVLRRR